LNNTVLHYAATVMLVRDTDQGMEVLMLERHDAVESFSGAYVFPGGKVDLHDAHEDYETLYSGHTDQDASRILNVPRYGLAYWMGAIRECFEEAGILIAYDRAGTLLSFADPAVRRRFGEHRDALNKGDRNLMEICREEGLRLATDQLYYFSHWVTPVAVPRRFDTRFFVCAAPPHQESAIDHREAVDQCWIRAAEALRRGKQGNFQILFPTIKHLKALAEFEDTRSLLKAAAAKVNIPRTLPMRVERPEGGYKILLPGDTGYDTEEVARTHY
jgi:8-oxo-dGTP pyrophosphatase MutT (NUDIX family)